MKKLTSLCDFQYVTIVQKRVM